MLEGVVIKTIGSTYTVRTATGEVHECLVRGKFRIHGGLKTTNPVAIGDRVDFMPADANTEHGIIHKLLDRKNYILRKAILQRFHVHILCANIDQAVFVFTLDEPRTSTGFLDRFLIVTEAYHIPVTIVFNKLDLVQAAGRTEEFHELQALYAGLGYPILEISANEPEYLPAVQALLANKTTFLCGHSGSGKSSLVNLVSPGLDLRTRTVSGYHKKGQHTTTHSEMFPMEGGGYVIDAPGIKELGIAHFDAGEVGGYFPEMRDRMHDCKFANCTHRNEPKCAILAALETGEIAYSRYRSYLGILEEVEAENLY